MQEVASFVAVVAIIRVVADHHLTIMDVQMPTVVCVPQNVRNNIIEDLRVICNTLRS